MSAKMNKTLGSRLRTAREAAGLSRDRLGAATGITGQTIYRIEQRDQQPDIATLTRLAAVLKIEITELLPRR